MTKASRPEITGGIIGDLTALASQEKPKHLGRGYAQEENMSGFEELRIIGNYRCSRPGGGCKLPLTRRRNVLI
jgi:hypothetical protein